MKQHEEEEKDQSSRWLLTYSDLITLLMIFFVVMYSISSLNAAKFARLAQILGKSFNGSQYVLEGYPGPSLIEGLSGGPDFSAPQEGADEDSFTKIQQILDNFIKENHLQGTVSHYLDERGLVVSLNNAALFDSGSADLHAQQTKVVLKIGEILKVLPNYIRVEGHTDNRPIHSAKFPSNWELSVLRATTVVQVLVNDAGLTPGKVSIVGYGEYRPMLPNDSSANMRLNRRVDIVIMKTEYNKWEPGLKKAP